MAERQPATQLRWEKCKDLLPREVVRANSVWFHGKLYIGGGRITGGHGRKECWLIAYSPAQDSWEEIKTPTYNFSLAVYRSQLVLVGGCFPDKPRDEPTNKVWWFQDGGWVEHPTIPGIWIDNAPHCVSESPAVGVGDNLFVAVKDVYNSLMFVVYDGEKWLTNSYASDDKFQPLMQSTVNGDDWFLSQGKKVYQFSLESIRSAQSVKKERLVLPDLPCEDAGLTIVWFENRLLAVLIGGSGLREQSPCAFALNRQSKTWDRIECISGSPEYPVAGCRDFCCGVLKLPDQEELLVCGGTMEGWGNSTAWKTTADRS